MTSLSELIMTRVSHDVAGISGALFNMAELLELDPSFAAEAGPLLKESTGALLARLRLFRALFGVETKEVATSLAVDYLKTLSAPFTLEGTIHNRWQLAAVLVCAELLIRGGNICVDDTQVTAQGQVHEDAETQAVFKKTFTKGTPRQAVALWLCEYAKQKEAAVDLSVLAKSVCVTFMPHEPAPSDL